jgi:vanillate O-demethylase monooxygenase subunit
MPQRRIGFHLQTVCSVCILNSTTPAAAGRARRTNGKETKETPMAFLRNAWYMAWWADEVPRERMVHRTLLGEQIVFYRRGDGSPVALRDRCPHRFVPLHMGRLRGDTVQCCYHGLEFDCTGRCVKNPHGDGAIPSAAKVRAYPLAERHGIVWIWMGEEEPDPARIPDYAILDAGSGYKTSRGNIQIKANYVLMGENLLDLSHICFLHEGLLGAAEAVSAHTEIREENGRLHCDRWMPNVTVPAAFDLLFRQDGKPVDMWTNMRWEPPSNFLLDVGVHAPGATREQGAWYFGVHILTPETAATTHYFFAAARPAGRELEPEVMSRLAEFRRIAFEEQDKPILDAQQAAVGEADFMSLRPALFSVDAGPVRMRRTLTRLLAAEEKRAQERTAPEAAPANQAVPAIQAGSPAPPAGPPPEPARPAETVG